jgi:hypothetical protein
MKSVLTVMLTLSKRVGFLKFRVALLTSLSSKHYVMPLVRVLPIDPPL